MSEEVRDLLARVTELQREKWELEERVSQNTHPSLFLSTEPLSLFLSLQVNHLETTGSALAEDVVNKSEIIKTFYMQNKAGQLAHCRYLYNT